MKNKVGLTFQEWWNKLWGYKYLANHKKSSKEVHDLSRHHVNCRTQMIANKQFVNRKEKDILFLEGYNGCRFCMPEDDKG